MDSRVRVTGFSLLELLVALFVIVLVTSMATLSVGTGSRDIRLEAQVRELANVASFALDEAQLSGLDYGLLLQRDSRGRDEVYSYAWRERREEGWRQPASGKEIFAPADFPPEIELQLELEESAGDSLVAAAGAVDASPQVIFYSSGETTPGAMQLRERENGAADWRVEWDLLGRFTVLRDGEPLGAPGDDEP